MRTTMLICTFIIAIAINCEVVFELFNLLRLGALFIIAIFLDTRAAQRENLKISAELDRNAILLQNKQKINKPNEN